MKRKTKLPFDPKVLVWLARRNTADLLAKGASEFAPGHCPAIVLFSMQRKDPGGRSPSGES